MLGLACLCVALELGKNRINSCEGNAIVDTPLPQPPLPHQRAHKNKEPISH